MTDIVKRLREVCNDTAQEAADEIERLRADRDERAMFMKTQGDAIERLQPENERLRGLRSVQMVMELEAEIERLRRRNQELKDTIEQQYATINDYRKKQ